MCISAELSHWLTALASCAGSGGATAILAHQFSFPHQFPPSSYMSSSNSHTSVSISQFQVIFDAALNEYSQKTGKDIRAHPLTARLQSCDSSDTVLGILQEQLKVPKQYEDWRIRLVRRLKPTVEILIGLSTGGAFGAGIGLVRLINPT